MTFIYPIETSDQKAVVACGIVFSFLAVLSVILRVLARHRANRVLDWSDFFVIAACPFLPFAYNWDRTIEGGVCGNPTVSWAATGVLNMISDLIILIMPMPYLLRLELAWEKRLRLAAIFSILVLPCIVSIVRITEMVKMDFSDLTFSSPHTLLLSSLEPCLGVMAACAMTMRPLFGGRYSPDGTADFNAAPIVPLAKKNSSRRFQPLNENTSETRLRPEEVGYQASIAKSPEPFKGFGSLGELGLEMGAISIRHEWIVKEEPRPRSSDTEKDKNLK
ncbi:hypothetical protein Daesc_008129 [Daldinia eschscholtzii]|uniref:Rhodopsin domain-containing protein n=1 Tax=Daldinia eschscholtzii TaxID=292717 RepID=A0AAX6MAU9_9PEZI